jgi:hypothetical protein
VKGDFGIQKGGETDLYMEGQPRQYIGNMYTQASFALGKVHTYIGVLFMRSYTAPVLKQWIICRAIH